MAVRCRRTLRAALTRAMKWGYVARNAAALTDAPKIVQREMTALTPDRGARIIESGTGDRLEALYTVALALGLRQGEALGLRWQDIDFEAARSLSATSCSAWTASLPLLSQRPQRVAARSRFPVSSWMRYGVTASGNWKSGYGQVVGGRNTASYSRPLSVRQ